MKKNSFSFFTLSTIEGYSVKETTYEDKKTLIVPATMMVEGVHHGSRGPLLHLSDEFGKFPDSWNGIPVVIDHPTDNEGQSISANDPEVLEARMVGRVFHTKVNSKKLKAKLYLFEDKLRSVSSDALAAVKDSEPLEVSIGVFSDEEEVEGEWNGEEYIAIARNHRPDHLALLPGGVGACSLEDGCGIRANSKNNNSNHFKKGGKNEMNGSDILKTFQSLKEQGYSLLEIIDNTSEGLLERLEAVRRTIDALDSNDTYHFIHEVYDDYVVYESRLRVGESKIYKQAYTYEAGKVKLTGDPVEVHKKVEYVTANNGVGKFKRTTSIKNNKEDNMSDTQKCTACVKKFVDGLIAHNQAVEDDRVVLEAMSEDQLKRLFPAKKEETAKPKPQENSEQPKPQTLSKEDQEALDYGKRTLAEKRQQMIKKIQDNAKDIFAESELKAMEIGQLEKVYKTAMLNANKEEEEGDGNFFVYGSRPATNSADEAEPMYPAGVEVE